MYVVAQAAVVSMSYAYKCSVSVVLAISRLVYGDALVMIELVFWSCTCADRDWNLDGAQDYPIRTTLG